jgi:hypothetical protein
VRANQVHRQQAINARKEEAPVHNAVQGGQLLAINAEREARHRGLTNAKAVVLQERSVRLGLMWVNSVSSAEYQTDFRNAH